MHKMRIALVILVLFLAALACQTDNNTSYGTVAGKHELYGWNFLTVQFCDASEPPQTCLNQSIMVSQSTYDSYQIGDGYP